MKYKNSEYGPLLLRITIGLMFVYSGTLKLLNPAGPVGLLTKIGFPMPTIWAWILLLSELIFGLFVFLGFKVKYTVWHLVIIMIVAITTVIIPNSNGNYGSLFLHLVATVGLIGLSLMGPGKMAVGK